MHPDLARLLELEQGQGRVTLLFAARDETHNNAVALKIFLEREHAKREHPVVTPGKV